MITPDDDSLSSSLPKSLRQHLYAGPRQLLDTSSQPTLPLPPLAAPVVSPSLALQPPSSASLLDLAGVAVHQPAAQTQRPIYSDPAFHTSRSSSLSRIINHTTPQYASDDSFGRRHSWREGEAGPSTLGPPQRSTRDPGAWRVQPKHEAIPPILSRDESPYRNAWSGADPHPTHLYHASPRHREQTDWTSRDSHALPPPSDVAPFPPQMGASLLDSYQSPKYEQRPDPLYLAPNPSTPPHHPATSRSAPTANIYLPPFQSSAPNDTALRETLRYFPSSSSSTLDNYTLPPPPSASPSPSILQSRASPRSFSDGQNPNSTHGDASSQILSQKRTKTPVACEFCRGRKLKCDGEKPRCKNCFERRFECRYPTFQRRRGPGKAPKGSRGRKRTGAAGSGNALGVSGHEPESSTSGRHMQSTHAEPSSHELEALAPEVRQYTSVINLDLYAFERPAEPPQYPSMQIPRPPESSSWAPRSRETSSEDRSDAEEMNRNER